MKNFVSVEIDHYSKDMTIAQLGKFMSDETLCKLISDLEEASEASCILQDGRNVVVRKERPDSVFAQQTTYEVVLQTEIPVSQRIFIMANNEEDAKATVQKLLAQNKISKEDFLSFSGGMENGFQFWIEQTEVDDWKVEDIYPKLSS
jgi:hypothetical protein